MHARFRFAPLLLALLFTGAAAKADDGAMTDSGPAIDGYGPTYGIPDRDVALPVDFKFRAVFDAASYAGKTSSLNTTLVSAARYLNMHARNGVAVENMQLAVVIHGAAVRSILNSESHNERYDEENPNLELVTRLHEAGVKFYVCGQSLTFGGFNKNELVPEAKVALSAMTMLTVLQSEGYALLP